MQLPQTLADETLPVIECLTRHGQAPRSTRERRLRLIQSYYSIDLYTLSFRGRNIRQSSLLVNAAPPENDAFRATFVALCNTEKNPDGIGHRGHQLGSTSETQPKSEGKRKKQNEEGRMQNEEGKAGNALGLSRGFDLKERGRMKNEEVKTKSTQPLSPGFQLVATLKGRPNAQLLPGGMIRPIRACTPDIRMLVHGNREPDLARRFGRGRAGEQFQPAPDRQAPAALGAAEPAGPDEEAAAWQAQGIAAARVERPRPAGGGGVRS